MFKILLVLSFFFTIVKPVHAQNAATLTGKPTQPVVLGKSVTIHSAILQEERTLNIYFPESYEKDSTLSFPVIYLLDGSANEDYIHICGLVQFLTMIGSMPPTIVVGIANVDRKRDFTFPTTILKDKAAYPTTGGSGLFMNFIELELQPFIKQHYRTKNTSTLIGQSLGGLFATEILCNKPQLFSNYIVVSPSLWWDNESLLPMVSKLKQYSGKDSLQVFITVGKEGKQMENDAVNLAVSIKKFAPATIHSSFRPLPKEDHLTILHQAVYAALLWLYRK